MEGENWCFGHELKLHFGEIPLLLCKVRPRSNNVLATSTFSFPRCEHSLYNSYSSKEQGEYTNKQREGKIDRIPVDLIAIDIATGGATGIATGIATDIASDIELIL